MDGARRLRSERCRHTRPRGSTAHAVTCRARGASGAAAGPPSPARIEAPRLHLGLLPRLESTSQPDQTRSAPAPRGCPAALTSRFGRSWKEVNRMRARLMMLLPVLAALALLAAEGW